MQVQMLVTGSECGILITYTTKDLLSILVEFDAQLMSQFLIKAEAYFCNIVMPEFVAGYYFSCLNQQKREDVFKNFF